jgi:site-specific recombinase XerD
MKMAHSVPSSTNLGGSSEGPKRLTRQHFALYRGYLDGVAEAQLHASYGDASTDLRSTRRLIAVLRDTLSVLARRARDTDAAYLLRLRPGSIPDLEPLTSPATPTLEAFRDRIDPEGVYSESELLELYRDTYPAGESSASDRRTARNARLRRRQAEALARMEASLVQDPQRDHPVDGWFEPAIAARLAAAKLTTIGDIIDRIEAKRHRWYADVPRLGPKGAQRVVDWLGLHAPVLGHTFSQRALVPRRQWTAELQSRSDATVAEALVVAPIESLRIPTVLDGSKGTNRSSRPAPRSFDTDVRAINAWLDARAASEHTRRAYRREAERILLWGLLEKHKPLSSLDAADCFEYVTSFLSDPQPVSRWVAPGRIERCLSGWRPFAGPLSDRSRETARSILSAMFEWLVATDYLTTNPIGSVERAAEPPVFNARGRALSVEQWQFVLASTKRSNYSFAEHRNRLALLLAYSTGLRRSEVSAATTGALSVGSLPEIEHPVWCLTVAGRRNGSRSVLLAPAVVETLENNLAMRGLPDLLSCPKQTPLIAQARGGMAVSADGIGRLFKQIFTEAAAQLERLEAGSGSLLTHASTHWLRHTHSIHALGHGASLDEISQKLGHAALATTAQYLVASEIDRFLGVETLIRRASHAKKHSRIA